MQKVSQIPGINKTCTTLITLAGGRPSGPLASRACPTIGPNKPPPLHLRYNAVSLKNKKHSDISFPHYRTHTIAAGASTASPACRWPSLMRRPSPAATFPFGCRAPTPPRYYRAPIPRRSLPPVARAARLAEPSPVLLAMVVVVVVLVQRRLRPWQLESPSLSMLQTYVSSVSDVFVGMFQVFHADVTKVDRDIAYVAMIVHVCCKCRFVMFHLSFQMYVASVFIWMCVYVSHICCKYFVCMLHMFAIIFHVFLHTF
jgi:hypothetical protein